jgi:hypothetical protein
VANLLQPWSGILPLAVSNASEHSNASEDDYTYLLLLLLLSSGRPSNYARCVSTERAMASGAAPPALTPSTRNSGDTSAQHGSQEDQPDPDFATKYHAFLKEEYNVELDISLGCAFLGILRWRPSGAHGCPTLTTTSAWAE